MEGGRSLICKTAAILNKPFFTRQSHVPVYRDHNYRILKGVLEFSCGFDSHRPLQLLIRGVPERSARAVALFGDRLPESAFKVEVDRKPLCEDEHLDA
jgi:hypothetical protein